MRCTSLRIVHARMLPLDETRASAVAAARAVAAAMAMVDSWEEGVQDKEMAMVLRGLAELAAAAPEWVALLKCY